MTSVTSAPPGRPARTIALGAALAAAGGLGLAVALVGLRRLAGDGSPERVAAWVAAATGVAALLPLAVYLLRTGRRADPARAAECLLLGVALALVGLWGFTVADAIRFRADILLWSESGFVEDILKLRLGYPLYTAPANLESTVYTPGAVMLTGLIARLFGSHIQIPVLRAIQVGYVALAAGVSALAALRLLEASGGERGGPVPSKATAAFWTAVLFLVGTNAITNPFTYLLHNDALSLLVCAVAYWILVEYARSGDRRWLFAMALVPALGFWVKQSLAIWAALYLAYLVVCDRRAGWRAIAAFAVVAFGGLALAMGLGSLLWGSNFVYWTVTVLRGNSRSLLRGVQHLLDAWTYLAVLLAGGLVLVAGRRHGPMIGLWLVALGLLLVEGYTSGIAWMRNHLGPGSLLAAVWLVAAFHRVVIERRLLGPAPDWFGWARYAAVALVAVTVLNGAGAVPVPASTLPAGLDRYAGAIEREFQGVPAARVLLDFGTWTYLADRVVMKDRAASIGDPAYSETVDLSGILGRIRTGYYRRILLRGLHAEDFTYDHRLWRHSSGIRDSLARYYREVRQIPAIPDSRIPWFQAISVLEPADTGRTEP